MERRLIAGNLPALEFSLEKLTDGFRCPKAYNFNVSEVFYVLVVPHVYVVYVRSIPDKKKIAFGFTFVYKANETTLFMLLTEKSQMTKKKTSKPQVAAPTPPTTEPDSLSRAVPARLFQGDLDALKEYEEMGMNMSDLIRRCVRKSLPEVVAEIRDKLSQRSKLS